MAENKHPGRTAEIVVVGSANLDTTARVPRLPTPGETVLGGDTGESVGGKGANQAVAAARLGRRVALVGSVGDDPAGRRIRAALTAQGVQVDHLGSTARSGSGAALIVVDESGENMIVVSPGANSLLTASHVRAARESLARAAAVVCQLEIPEEAVVEAVRLAGGRVILNPSPVRPVPPEVMARVDVLIVNRSELGAIAGAPEPESVDGAAALASGVDGPRAVVVTLGADGALLVERDTRVHVPAVRVPAVVDPTGAGDTFCGALTDALVRGATLDDAVRWAVRAAAFAVTGAGAQSAMPTAAQLETA
ncbi:ribokinase [Tomitella fengzijianii]|uniref:Ribokinase n=1 Tax=Tomitella fengzijianii TaxID=2597660 RepID=A0A516X3J0_9ACTN|nr:ribokinase [Tomitella fengzijianii]QDQ97627.1 ribokinase [Tomitella fengzijianii]